MTAGGARVSAYHAFTQEMLRLEPAGQPRPQETETSGNPCPDLKFNITHETKRVEQDRLVHSCLMNSCPLCKTQSLQAKLPLTQWSAKPTQPEHLMHHCRALEMSLWNFSIIL